MQQVATRRWATAGVALTAASMVAVAPVVGTTLPTVEFPDIQLTGSFDPISPWIDTFSKAGTNGVNLFNAWGDAPFALGQQIAVNQIRNLDTIVNHPADIGSIFTDTVDRLGKAVAAPFVADQNLLDTTQPIFGGALGPLLGHFLLEHPGTILNPNRDCPLLVACLGLDLSHKGIFNVLNSVTSGNALLNGMLGFTASPVSGLLLGAAGPVVGPGIALGNDVTSVFGALTGGSPDLVDLLNTVVNIPAHMTDALFNGGEVLDAAPVLNSLLSQVPLFEQLSQVVRMDTLGFEMGGLLSPGGSLFSAFTMGATVLPDLTILGIHFGDVASFLLPGADVGLLGTAIELPQSIARAIGWTAGGMPLDAFISDALLPTGLLPGALGNMVDIPNLLLGGLLGIVF